MLSLWVLLEALPMPSGLAAIIEKKRVRKRIWCGHRCTPFNAQVRAEFIMFIIFSLLLVQSLVESLFLRVLEWFFNVCSYVWESLSHLLYVDVVIQRINEMFQSKVIYMAFCRFSFSWVTINAYLEGNDLSCLSDMNWWRLVCVSRWGVFRGVFPIFSPLSGSWTALEINLTLTGFANLDHLCPVV